MAKNIRYITCNTQLLRILKEEEVKKSWVYLSDKVCKMLEKKAKSHYFTNVIGGPRDETIFFARFFIEIGPVYGPFGEENKWRKLILAKATKNDLYKQEVDPEDVIFIELE